MNKLKLKNMDSNQITMLCIRFCEEKRILNQQMNLSEIERIRYNTDLATQKLNNLVKYYGNDEDKKYLEDLKSND